MSANDPRLALRSLPKHGCKNTIQKSPNYLFRNKYNYPICLVESKRSLFGGALGSFFWFRCCLTSSLNFEISFNLLGISCSSINFGAESTWKQKRYYASDILPYLQLILIQTCCCYLQSKFSFTFFDLFLGIGVSPMLFAWNFSSHFWSLPFFESAKNLFEFKMNEFVKKNSNILL